MRIRSAAGLAALLVVVGLAGARAFRAAPEAASATAAEPPRPVIVVILDTARRDHFSTYGYDRETTPVFTRFAEGAVRFDRAYSTSSWTVPSHASLFTGQYAMEHGATQETQFLADDARTLAEILAERGYATAAVSGNPWVSPRANLTQGFEEADVVWTGARQAEGTGLPHAGNAKVFRWLDSRDDSRPFFLFVNYIEPHWRYRAPEELQRRFVPGGEPVDQDDPALFSMNAWYLRPEQIDPALLPIRTGMYDADLAFADRILGELLDGLDARSLLDSCLVVVTSDHGENHGDAGHMGHVFSLTEATIRIPLAIRRPGGAGAGTVRDDPVQLVDLFPTVLAAAGVEAPGGGPGRNLFAGPGAAERPILTEYYYPLQVLDSVAERNRGDERLRPFLRRLRSVTIGSDKLVWGSDGRHALYDLSADPGETESRYVEQPARADTLQQALARLVARFDRGTGIRSSESAEPPALDPQTEEQLRALGYLE